MSIVRRRIIMALILIFLITTMFSITAYAARDNSTLDQATDSIMDGMGAEVFIWFRAFRACIIPLLIVRFASTGLKLMGNTLLAKGEYKRDEIKTDILYSIIAAAFVVLMPTIIGWAIALFASGGWKPPSTSY